VGWPDTNHNLPRPYESSAHAWLLPALSLPPPSSTKYQSTSPCPCDSSWRYICFSIHHTRRRCPCDSSWRYICFSIHHTRPSRPSTCSNSCPRADSTPPGNTKLAASFLAVSHAIFSTGAPPPVFVTLPLLCTLPNWFGIDSQLNLPPPPSPPQPTCTIMSSRAPVVPRIFPRFHIPSH